MADEKEVILQFIQDYKCLVHLWDQSHPKYKDAGFRYQALTELGEKYNIDLKSVKTKIKNLRSYFSREHQRVVRGGTGGDDGYKSSWFAYNALTFILESSSAKDIEHVFVPEMPIERASDDESSDSHSFITCDNNPSQKKRNPEKPIKKEPEDIPYKITKCTDQPENRDEFAIFGALVENKLRNLSRRNQILAQRRVCDVFFELEMEEVNESQADDKTLAKAASSSEKF